MVAHRAARLATPPCLNHQLRQRRRLRPRTERSLAVPGHVYRHDLLVKLWGICLPNRFGILTMWS